MRASKRIFVDADGFIALNFYKHPQYKKAVSVAKKVATENYQVYTCTYTLLEFATIANMYFPGKRGPELASEILLDPQIKVIKGDLFLEKGFSVMGKQRSKNISLNDCVYFAICKELKIRQAFSFDRHWKKNGFELL